MRIQETEIFKFDELSEEAKSKAVQSQVDFLHQDVFLSEMISEELTYVAEENYGLILKDLDLQFSLSSCQGDGVAFYGKLSSVEMLNIMNRVSGTERYSELFNSDYHVLLEKFDEIDLTIGKNSFGHHYSHFNTMETEINLEGIETETHDFLYENLLPMLDGLEESFKILVKDISKDLEQSGYSTIEGYTSEENAIESITINEYEFLSSGAMA